MSKLSEKTHCPRPGCDGAFTSYTQVVEESLHVQHRQCNKCDYHRTMYLNGPFAGHFRYTKDGQRVKFTDE